MKQHAYKYYYLLLGLDACGPAVNWVRDHLDAGKTPEQIWNACDCADWMMWLLHIPKPDKAFVDELFAYHISRCKSPQQRYIECWAYSFLDRQPTHAEREAATYAHQEFQSTWQGDDGYAGYSAVEGILTRPIARRFWRTDVMEDIVAGYAGKKICSIIRKHYPWQRAKRHLRKVHR